MRTVLAAEVERARVDGESGSGCNGIFELRDEETGNTLVCIVNDGRDWAESNLPGEPWEHVSVSKRYGVPTWAQMAWVKSVFWEPDECVIEYHPAKADYVNIHARVLHLWRPTRSAIPMPPRECV